VPLFYINSDQNNAPGGFLIKGDVGSKTILMRDVLN